MGSTASQPQHSSNSFINYHLSVHVHFTETSLTVPTLCPLDTTACQPFSIFSPPTRNYHLTVHLLHWNFLECPRILYAGQHCESALTHCLLTRNHQLLVHSFPGTSSTVPTLCPLHFYPPTGRNSESSVHSPHCSLKVETSSTVPTSCPLDTTACWPTLLRVPYHITFQYIQFIETSSTVLIMEWISLNTLETLQNNPTDM